MEDEYTLENALFDNAQVLDLAQKHNANYIMIDDNYEIHIELTR